MQLMILGMHRSGTSVLARILNLMGVYFGPEGMSTGANKENPKGFWERRDVRELNDMVLHSTGCDWNRVLEFEIEKVPESMMADFNKGAARVILEMDAHRPWLMKEPRLCLLLPLWRRFLEVPVCVHILRHPVEVASSLRTRNKIPIDVGLVLWDRYVRDALQASADLPGVIVSHRQLMDDPSAATSVLLANLQSMKIPNLRMPTEREIESFIRADLYRERETRSDLAGYADAPQVKFFKRLTAGKPMQSNGVRSMSKAAKETLAQYEASLPPFESPKPTPRPMPEPERILREELALKSQEVRFLRELSENASAQTKGRDERLAALDRELTSAREAAGKLEKRVADNTQLRQTIDRLGAELTAAVEARITAETNVSDRFLEIELLTRLLMEQELVSRKAEGDANALGARLEQAEAEASDLNKKLVQAETKRRDSHENLAQAEARMRAANAKLDGAIRDSAAEQTRLRGEVQMHASASVKAVAQVVSQRRELDVLCRQIGQLTLRAASQRNLNQALDLQLQERGNSIVWRIAVLMRKMRRMVGRNLPEPAAPADDLSEIRRSELFDAAWYVEHYPDVLENSVDPAEHYFEYGAYEGRNPGPFFDTGFYLSRHADVAESGQNPLVHFIRHGRDEARSIGGEGK